MQVLDDSRRAGGVSGAKNEAAVTSLHTASVTADHRWWCSGSVPRGEENCTVERLDMVRAGDHAESAVAVDVCNREPTHTVTNIDGGLKTHVCWLVA